MTIEQYLTNINQRYQLGNATEHTFRGDLQQLIESLVKDVRATNEPKRQSCGAPDYILTKKEIPVGFIEAKDIGDKDLEGKKKTGNKEQFDRYKASLNNLIFTDYLDFHIYQDGAFITKVAIATISEKGIQPLPENFKTFENLLKDFCTHVSQTIKSSKKLAEMMAGKARLLSDVIEKALTSDETHNEDSTLKEQMLAFKNILIHDITPKGFADVYAQTIAYGLFAARLHDPTLESFTRQEAAELIPKSNPFLRKLFGYIAGPDIDDRIKWIVDNLTEIFLACNVEEILKNYGKSTKMEDPIIHFYETFLSEYDPKLRKARGVWYTPAPVVNFIVRAVDDILKTEFNLPQGLADTSKTTIKVKTDIANKNYSSGYKEVDQEVHKVQILDPATGTGTFLAEVIKHIHKKFKGQEGIWSSYVENSLLPRLNGFELLMASYAMAHLQLDLLLKETGFKPASNQRTRVYLTNSLEEFHPDTGTLFANWLSSEANEANHIKRDTPVMCVIGNPPYSGESANKGDWIMSLMDDYKKEPGGKEKLKERNPKMINDDYVKFLRYGQHYIEKNGSGILAFINPHGYLDNMTFRGMRWNLLKTFNQIYVLDLNGNVKKKKVGVNGELDENVFDITTGVSINILVKTNEKSKTKVKYYELLGKRKSKYEFLETNNLNTIQFKDIKLESPNFYMNYKDTKGQKDYNNSFSVNDIFNFKLSGLSTKNDNFCIKHSRNELSEVIIDLKTQDAEELKKKYNISNESSSWSLTGAIQDVNTNYSDTKIVELAYRPFDTRFSYYTGNSMGFMGRPKGDLGNHLINSKNLSLVTVKKSRSSSVWNLISVANKMICEPTTITSLDGNYGFPLYLYPETNNQQLTTTKTERVPNLNQEIVNQLAKTLGLTFTPEKETESNVCFANSSEVTNNFKTTFAPIDILDYIYAVLHSPTYREKYKEFLKIDFPRVPYPTNTNTFWQLVNLGGELRQLHLLESPTVENYSTQYPISGNNIVDKPRYVKCTLQNSPPLEGCPQDGVALSTTKQGVYLKKNYIQFTPILELPYNPNLKQRAKELRQAKNLSEVLFWQQVHKGKFYNIDFDRQRIIGNYIVDFYVKKLGLVVEIDGTSHIGKEDYDAERESYLESLGLKIVRFSVNAILKNMNQVMEALENYIVLNYAIDEDAYLPPRLSGTPPEKGNLPPRPLGTPPLEGNYGNVYINDTQYFANVPQVAWEFYIGGYQPAQKWLKDRKDRILETEDIFHYQKIIVALTETDRLMKEIDNIAIA
jgi:very-short-patch-repair endonuclease